MQQINGWNTPDFSKALNLTSISAAEPLRANLEGRASYITGSDPLPSFDIPFVPEIVERKLESGVNTVVKYSLAGVAGIVVIGIGLAALLFAGRGAIAKTVTG